jgi:hypothetical protein
MQEIKSLRPFGFFMSAAFFILGAGIPLLKNKEIHPLLTVIACAFLFFTLVYPEALRNVRKWWLILGEKLGLINSRILFTILYLTLFSLVHLVFKMMGRDKFKKKWKGYDSTYSEKQKISSFADPF